MQKYQLPFLFLCFLNLVLSSPVNDCYNWINNSFYSLEKLESNTQNVNTVEDPKTHKQDTLYWNTCSNYVKKYPDHKTYFVLERTLGQGQKETLYLTGDAVESVQSINKEDPDKGYIINYNHSKDGITLTLNLKCDKSQSGIISDISLSQQGEFHYEISMTTDQACPKLSLSALWETLKDYKPVMVIGMIAFGILNCFLGYKFFKFTLFSIGFLFAFILTLAISSLLISSTSEDYASWIAISVATTAGIAFGILLYKVEKLGFFILGAVGAYVLGVMLYESFLSEYFQEEYFVYLYYGILVVVGGLLGLWVRKAVTIIVTSLVGSYLLVRSASLFIENGDYFPNEFTLAKMIESGAFKFPDQFYYFLGAIIFLWIVGVLIQYQTRRRRRGPEEEQLL